MSDKKSVKVLVVDDSGTIRKTAEAILTKEGYTVATAEDGFSALSKVMSFKPDLIFLDIQCQNPYRCHPKYSVTRRAS